MTSKKKYKEELERNLYNRSGYLPNQYIVMLSHLGIIRGENSIDEGQFQPVSLDLRLGEKAYRIQSSFLPENDTVEAKLKDVKLYEFDLQEGGILEKGAVYLIPLMEELVFPRNICGRTNPKSSTGRLDIFTRVIVDKGHRFDEIPTGYKGKMYLEIISRTFPVKVCAGLSLNQLRVFKGVSGISDNQLEDEYKNNPLLYNGKGFLIPWKQVKVDGGLFVSVDISGDSGESIIAYKAKHNSQVIDLSKIRHYHAEDFWEPVYPQKKNRLILEPESFYIMMSKEKICVWPHLLAEMIAYEPNSGELRTHYAGFFDPGFGWHGDGVQRQGTHAVMEVRPHDVPFMVEDGQTFCRLKFEKVIDSPTKVYGKDLKSNYQKQNLALSKYFKN
ncbi:MAG: 2'-deoxycytidine 5'-triphosphate deaminase [Nitrospinota bacterium]|nr:2'-deoxycytidine 5'-triphosphate deaminase [Nitrospinota bacterium]